MLESICLTLTARIGLSLPCQLLQAVNVDVMKRDKKLWDAIRQRDKSFDGQFVFGVQTTGVYCRPGCPSRTPQRENVILYPNCQAAEEAGYRACLRCRPKRREPDEVAILCKYIRDHLDEPLPLSRLSEVSGLSPFHLQRKFKAALGITPRQFAEQERLSLLKTEMRKGHSVTEAIYTAGFGSSSRVYERTGAHLGMTPKTYQKGGHAETIYWATQPTQMGLVLVAATGKGICFIELGDSEKELSANLRAEFPGAEIVADAGGLKAHLEQLSGWLTGSHSRLDLPLDVRATAFQRRVWEYLQKIPYGETRTYTEVARDLGAPNAVRAVARACATNPVAIAIPCHRVVRQDGHLAGYRWGLGIKEALLSMESAGKSEQVAKNGYEVVRR